MGGWLSGSPRHLKGKALADGFCVGSERELASLGASWGASAQLGSPQPVFEATGSPFPVINEHFPFLGPRWGTDGMWLWLLWVVLGFGEPWSVGCSCLLGRALLTDVRLLGWVGMLMGG